MPDANKYEKLYLILQDISNALVITDRISSLTDYLLDVAIKYVDAESGSLMLLNEQETLSILSSRGLDASFVRSFASQKGDAISRIMLKKREPMLVQDISRHPEFRSEGRMHYKTRSFISCPILFRQRFLGIINVNDKRDRSPFSQDELDLLKIVANNAAIALENASLLNRLKTAAADLEEMNRRLIDSDILKMEFLTSISHELRTPLNAVKGAIYYLENHDPISPAERREFHGIISSETDNLASSIDSLIRFLEVDDESRVLDKETVNITEVLAGLPVGQLKSVLADRGISFSLGSVQGPLWVVGDRLRISQLFTNLLIGLASYLSPDDAIDLTVSSSSDLLAFNIDLSRPLPRSVLQQLNGDTSLYPSGSSDTRVRIYLARNTAIAHRWMIAAANESTSSRITITCPLNSKETFNAYIKKSIDLFVESVSDTLNTGICSVMLNDDLTGELRIASARGLDDKVIKTTSIKQGDKIAGWVALEGKPLFISDIESDARFSKKSIPQYNNKSLMSIPLKIDDRVIGVLNLNNKRSSETFSQEDYDRALELVNRFTSGLRDAFARPLSENEIFQLIADLDRLGSSPYDARRRSPKPPV